LPSTTLLLLTAIQVMLMFLLLFTLGLRIIVLLAVVFRNMELVLFVKILAAIVLAKRLEMAPTLGVVIPILVLVMIMFSPISHIVLALNNLDNPSSLWNTSIII